MANHEFGIPECIIQSMEAENLSHKIKSHLGRTSSPSAAPGEVETKKAHEIWIAANLWTQASFEVKKWMNTEDINSWKLNEYSLFFVVNVWKNLLHGFQERKDEVSRRRGKTMLKCLKQMIRSRQGAGTKVGDKYLELIQSLVNNHDDHLGGEGEDVQHIGSTNQLISIRSNWKEQILVSAYYCAQM